MQADKTEVRGWDIPITVLGVEAEKTFVTRWELWNFKKMPWCVKCHPLELHLCFKSLLYYCAGSSVVVLYERIVDQGCTPNLSMCYIF